MNKNEFPYDKISENKWWPRENSSSFKSRSPHFGEQPKFQIDKKTKIMSAGSCFAQRISFYLKKNDYLYMDYEKSPTTFHNSDVAKQHGYQIYSARYGNVYSAKQMLQLVQRATGRFTPSEDYWVDEKGRFYDPFRPTIEPEGFLTVDQLLKERSKHFQAVLKLINDADILIFTLGLTEIWQSLHDGAVYPICPGKGFGTYCPDKYRPVNQKYAEILNDLENMEKEVKSLNKNIKIILTVSPVPLIATFSNNNIFKATCYSKSLLRIAAEEFTKDNKNAEYFASFEIATNNFLSNSFDKGGRNLVEDSVDKIMDCFFDFFSGDIIAEEDSLSIDAMGLSVEEDIFENELINIQNEIGDICDEENILYNISKKK